MNTLYITYCSADKHHIPEGSPKQLYDTQRITDFITLCEDKHYNWAILSAKYGLFFPDEVHEYYNVTFWTKSYKCRIKENDELLSEAESQERLAQLTNQISQRIREKNIKSIVFFYDHPLQRRKCYLNILHAGADSCRIEHDTCDDLKRHISKMFSDGTGKIQLSKAIR